jgi:fatty acid desaturase
MVSILDSDYQPKLTIEEAEHEMAQLQKIVEESGLLKRSYVYYSLYAIIYFSIYFSTLYLLSINNSYLAIVILAIVIGFISTQFAGLMHDAVHQGICNNKSYNSFLAHLFSITSGSNPRQWKPKHLLHHAHPNTIDEDPDVKIIAFSFTKERYLEQTGIFKWLRSIQHLTYFPFCSFYTYFAHYTQLIQPLIKKCKTELDYLIVFDFLWSFLGLSMWYGIPFLLLEPLKAILFICVASASLGLYIANIFAPNHKGMPQIKKGVPISNLEQQIITTRNVTPGFFYDILFLSLNYQIEHHLFPHMPRNKYKLVAPHIKEMCERLKLPYLVMTPFNSYKAIIKELHKIAKNGEES